MGLLATYLAQCCSIVLEKNYFKTRWDNYQFFSIVTLQGVPKKTIRFWHCFLPWLNCLTWYLIKWFVKYSIWEFQPWVRFFPLTSIAKTVAIFPKHTFFSDLFFVNFMKIREIPWYTFSVIKSKILVIRRKVNPF